MLHHITQQKAPSSIRVEDHIIDAFASFRQWDPMDAGAPRKELHVVTKKKIEMFAMFAHKNLSIPSSSDSSGCFLCWKHGVRFFGAVAWCPARCGQLLFSRIMSFYVVLKFARLQPPWISICSSWVFSDHGKTWAKLLSNCQVQSHFRFDQVAMCETSGCAKKKWFSICFIGKIHRVPKLGSKDLLPSYPVQVY